MGRIKLILSVTAAVSVMSVAAAPAMADVEIERSGGSNGKGFTSIVSSSNLDGGSGDSFVFYSTDSSFDDLHVEGSEFHFD